MRILVIGGHGFMGKNIQAEFFATNHTMFYESRRTGLDLLDYKTIINKLNEIQPDIIIHAAAHVGSIAYVSKFAADVVHDNSMQYLNLYKAIAEVNKMIVVINPISNCSYPGIIDVQHENMWWDGAIHQSVESYGTPKKLGYVISECYKRQYGIKTVNLIVPNAYGPNDYLDETRTHAMNGIIMRMMKSLKNNDKEFVVWGTGSPIREWIYMPDMARIFRQIIDDKIIFDLPNPINIGQENGISIIESVNKTKELLNYDVEIILDKTKQDGAPIKVLGNKLFKKYFQSFVFTDFVTGINNTIEYYKDKI